MFRLALKRAATTATRTSTSGFFYSTNPINSPYHKNRVTHDMIQYALSHARSQKSGDSYAQAMMILEQGASNLKQGDSSDDAVGMFMFAMSTLLYERGEIRDAMEKLQMVQRLECASQEIKVAALEGLVGLNLEAGEDGTASMLANDCFALLPNSAENDQLTSNVKLRAKDTKELVHLARGELKSAKSLFDGCEDLELKKDPIENASLSNGEFLHATGKFSEAKDIYEKVFHTFDTKEAQSSHMASANMVAEEVLLGVTCALGQLLSHSGKFGEAEDLLTKALTKAEEHFGSTHPKVGVVLTCIAMMFKHKAKLEASSSILIQEGLYRRAIDLLKAPGLDSGVADNYTAKRDIVALARDPYDRTLNEFNYQIDEMCCMVELDLKPHYVNQPESLCEMVRKRAPAIADDVGERLGTICGYAEILSIQQNRKGEGEQLKNWAEAAWKNCRLSLAEALDFSQPSVAPIIDTRICRVI